MKRLISAALILFLLIGILSVGIVADDAEYTPMATSQSMIDIIKDFEGFVSMPYRDGGQYSIGYGTFCGQTKEEVPVEYWGGITKDRAEQMLRNYLTNVAEMELNKFYKRIGYQPTQQQFDAMIDFTYNLGGSWMSDSKVKDYIVSHTAGSDDPVELINLLGAWCRVGDTVTDYLCSRRIREALIYLHGEYYLPYGNEESDLETVYDSKLPRYRYVIYNGNGVAISSSGYNDTVAYFAKDEIYGTLLNPTRKSYTFAGWYNADGDLLITADVVKSNQKVKARWVKLPFTDVLPNVSYTMPVAYCYEKGIIKGVSTTAFAPDEGMTRGALVTMLYRMAGEPAVSGGNSFSDVEGGRYFTDPVTWAADLGITTGYHDGTFRPDALVTRAEMVTFLCRYASKVKNLDITPQADLSKFSDYKTVPSFAQSSFAWAVKVGIINGTMDNTLIPMNTATRGQMAKVLMILDNME